MEDVDPSLLFETTKDFTKSLQAIEEFEKLLSCNLCHKIMETPVTLWSCDHIFCKNCVMTIDKCSICSLPAWSEDQRENKAITNVNKICTNLKEILQSYMKQKNNSTTSKTNPIAENVQNTIESTIKSTSRRNSKLRSAPKYRFPPGTQDFNSNNDAIGKEIDFNEKQNKEFTNKTDTSTKHVQSSFKRSESKTNTTEPQPPDTEVASNDQNLQNVLTPPQPKKRRTSRGMAYRTPSNSVKRFSFVKSPAVKTPRSAKKNKKGETPLHLAAIKGNLQDLQNFIKEGCDVNAKDNAGWSPLHEACNHGHLDVAIALLDAGASVNIPGCDNDTPLIDAVVNNHTDVVLLLLDRGADVDLRNMNGNTALSVAGTSEMKNLLNKFCSAESKEKSTVTPDSIKETSAPDLILISHSSSVKRDDVIGCATSVGGDISPGNAQKSTHHVVSTDLTGRCPRTIKYLESVARGIWIIQSNWLEACKVSDGWVTERSFEVAGSTEDIIEGGPKKSRLNRIAQCPGILSGCHFYFSGNFKRPGPTKDQLSVIIQLAGGQVLSREPKHDSDRVQICTKVPYHSEKDTPQAFYTYYIVYDPIHGKPIRFIRRGKVCTVPLSWLFDCVSQFMICDIPE